VAGYKTDIRTTVIDDTTVLLMLLSVRAITMGASMGCGGCSSDADGERSSAFGQGTTASYAGKLDVSLKGNFASTNSQKAAPIGLLSLLVSDMTVVSLGRWELRHRLSVGRMLTP
jgi:hypothetical protein